MFGHKEADVDASAGAVQRAWRKRRQSVDLGAAEGLSEAQILINVKTSLRDRERTRGSAINFLLCLGSALEPG